MRRGPDNRRLAPRLCAAVLVLVAAAVLHAGCNDDKTLTETISRGLRKTPIPGAIVGVWREGEPPYVRAFGMKIPNARPSMLLDHMAGRASEIDAINGAIPPAAAAVGLAAPYNEVISGLVRAKERRMGWRKG